MSTRHSTIFLTLALLFFSSIFAFAETTKSKSKTKKQKAQTVTLSGKIKKDSETKKVTYVLEDDNGEPYIIPKISSSKVKRFVGKNVTMKAKALKGEESLKIIKVISVKPRKS